MSKHTEVDWMEQANCLGARPDFFFPSDLAGVIAAQEICARCVVKQQCLDYALDNKIGHGIWGGASERDRRGILRARREAQVQNLNIVSETQPDDSL